MPTPDNPAVEQIRHVLMSTGWREHMAPGIAAEMDQAKANLCVAESERQGNFAKWSTERIGGYAIGLGWALNHWLAEIRRYDAQRVLEAQEDRMNGRPEPSAGSPYVAEEILDAPSDR